MKRSLAVLLFLSIIAAGAHAQDAQNVAKGFSVDKTYDFNSLDQINTFNGNLNLSIPLGIRYPVSSDLSYQFVLTYAGNTWESTSNPHWEQNPITGDYVEDFYDAADVNTYVDNAGMGWKLSFGSTAVGAINSVGAYTSADGAEHAFYENLHDGETKVLGVYYTRDGSLLRMRVLSDGSREIDFPSGTIHKFNSSGYVVEMRDQSGNRVTFSYKQGIDGALDWDVTDSSSGRTHHVDVVRLSYPGASQWTYHDVVKTISLAREGGTSVYTFNYLGGDTMAAISRQAVGRQDCEVAPTTRAAILSSVSFPDGTSYAVTTDIGDATGFTYDVAGPLCSSYSIVGNSGHLQKIKLPTGGTIEWTYMKWQFPSLWNRTSCKDVYSCQIPVSSRTSVGVKERIERDRNGNIIGRKVYDHVGPFASGGVCPPQPSGVSRITTFLGPFTPTGGGTVLSKSLSYYRLPYVNGTDRTEYGMPFTRETIDPEVRLLRPDPCNSTSIPAIDNSGVDGVYLSSKVYDANDRLLEYGYVAYEADPYGTSLDENSTNRRVLKDRQVKQELTSGGSMAVTSDVLTTNSDYDGLGHYRTSLMQSRRNAALKRTTKTEYNRRNALVSNEGPNVGTFPLTFTMLTNTDRWILGTYSSQVVDDGSKVAKSLFWFDPLTGHLLRKRTFASLGTSPTEPGRGAHDLVAAYVYNSDGNLSSESYYGGDGQSLDTTSDLKTMSLSSAVTTLSHSYAYGVLRRTDYAGASFPSRDDDIEPATGLVSVSRDSAGIATTFVHDEVGRTTTATPTGRAATTYSYSIAPTAATVTIARNGGAAGTINASVNFDAFGRVWRENRRIGGQSTDSTRETLYDAVGRAATISEYGNLSKITSYAYDSRNRAVLVTAPDETQTTTTYSAASECPGSVSTCAMVRRAARDSSGDKYVTTELYDDFGRLVRVTDAVSTADYTYDVGGHLSTVALSADNHTQPRSFNYDGRGFLTSEVHPESATTSYTYDARGKVLTRTTPKAVITFNYDAAERVLNVWDGSSILKEFGYDRTVPGNAGRGKLDFALRHNYGSISGKPDVTVKETYTYGDSAGRLTNKTTEISTGDTFSDTYTYDALDNLTDVTYPSCVSGCPGLPSLAAKTVHSTFDQGMVRSVNGYTTTNGIAYWPNGLLNKIQLRNVDNSNGPLYEQTGTDDGMPRPKEIKVSQYCEMTATLTPKTVAENAPANLTVTVQGAGSMPTYAWYEVGQTSPIAGQTTATLTVSVPWTTQYYVRVGNGSCTVDSDPVTVTVSGICPAPPATMTMASSVEGGLAATASVPVTANATYSWSITNGTIASGQGTPVITFVPGCTGTTVTVSVTVASCDKSSSNSKTAAITQIAGSMFGTINSTAGAQVKLEVYLTGSGPWTVSWSTGDVVQYSVSPGVLYVSPSIDTTYTATVAKNGCSKAVGGSTSVHIVTCDRPNALIGGTVSTVYPYAQATAAPGAWIAPGTTFAWEVVSNGTLVSGASNENVQFKGYLPGQNVRLRLTETNSCGVSDTQILDIPVSSPAATVMSASPASITVGAGQSSTLSVYLLGAPPFKVVWSDGYQQTIESIGATQGQGVWSVTATRVVTPVNTTSYTVSSYEAAGFAGTISGSATVTVNCTAAASVSGSATIMAGQSATLSVSLTGVSPWTVEWSDGLVQSGITQSPLTRVVTPNATTTYTVRSVTDLNQCAKAGTGSAVVTVTPVTPTNLVATAISTNQVQLAWYSAKAADRFEVQRRSGAGAFADLGSSTTVSFTDATAAASTAYVYRVRAVLNGVASEWSTADVATTIVFTDDPLEPGTTFLKAAHVTELRTAINAVRTTAGLAAATYTAVGVNVIATPAMISEMRTALDQARAALTLPTLVYVDPAIGSGSAIKAVYILNLRDGLR